VIKVHETRRAPTPVTHHVSRAALIDFAQPPGNRDSALRRDECGYSRIYCRRGHIYAPREASCWPSGAGPPMGGSSSPAAASQLAIETRPGRPPTF
jgi:hypothetical protein